MAEVRTAGSATLPAIRVLGQKLDSIPFSRYHVLIIAVLGFVGFVEGYVSDHWSRKRIMQIGVVGTTLFTLMIPLVQNAEQLMHRACSTVAYLPDPADHQGAKMHGSYGADSHARRAKRLLHGLSGIARSSLRAIVRPVSKGRGHRPDSGRLVAISLVRFLTAIHSIRRYRCLQALSLALING